MRYHGITDTTYKNFVIDSGEVRLNYVDQTDPGTLLGATRGGTTFTIETEYRDMPVDGAKGKVKGGRRITKVDAKMVCNFVEFSSDIIKMALPGSAITNHPTATPTHDEIKRSLAIALGDYHASIALIGQVSGSELPIICLLKNALADGNFEISAVDNEESVLAMTFSAHFDTDNLDLEPYLVRYPQGLEASTTTPGA